MVLKDGKTQIKGLVVEQHADRVILSTEMGEVPVLREQIREILFEEAEQNFYAIGKKHEENQKWGEALSYYEKALEVNPNFEEAQKAADAMRNRFWADSVGGPQAEIENRQILHDSWDSNRPVADVAKSRLVEREESLREGLGVTLDKRGDWIRFAQVGTKKPAALAGLKRGDRLVSIDGTSLRFLGVEAVQKHLVEPHFTSFTLEFERDLVVKKDEERNLKELGLKLKLEYRGLVVDLVRESSAAAKAGLKEGDLVSHVGGEATRYMQTKKAVELIESAEGSVAFTIRRSALLMRK